MAYAYITYFKIRNHKLKVIEEWLITESLNLKLLKFFQYDHFNNFPQYDMIPLKTALISDLLPRNRVSFFKLLNEIAKQTDYELLYPFSTYDDIGLSFENEFIENYYQDKKYNLS